MAFEREVRRPATSVRPSYANTFQGSIPREHGCTHTHIPTAWNGHDEVVQLLLKPEVDNEARNVYGWTPLHLSSVRGWTSAVQILLNYEATFNVKTGVGWTPLYGAAASNAPETVQLLLDWGAHINDNADLQYGGVTLWEASKSGYDDILKILLEKGADSSIESVYGTTPMHGAMFRGHEGVVKLLLATIGSFAEYECIIKARKIALRNVPLWIDNEERLPYYLVQLNAHKIKNKNISVNSISELSVDPTSSPQ